MGNKPAPSLHVKSQWQDDEGAKKCTQCLSDFSAFKRKHHCRCCGAIFCRDCWGQRIDLPSEYQYEDLVPVCIVCYELVEGHLKVLLSPKRCVLTRTLKSKKGPALPPLSPAQRKDRVEVFYIKLGHWRPLGANTCIQFAKTVAVADAAVSAALRCDDVAPQNEEDDPESQDDPDIAWSLSLGAIVSIMLDHHEDGDFISIETAQEFYRVQVANKEGVAFPQPAPKEVREEASLVVPGVMSTHSSSSISNAAEKDGRKRAAEILPLLYPNVELTAELFDALLDCIGVVQQRAGTPVPVRSSISKRSRRSGK